MHSTGMTYVVASGTFITGRGNAGGSIVLKADHTQVVDFLARVAACFNVEVRGYGTGAVPGAARALINERAVEVDSALADRLVVLHGHAALVFVLLHEVGHLRHPKHAGKRRGERLADEFAAWAMRCLRYSPGETVAAAAATLAGTMDDGVHDSGAERLRAIARHVGLTLRYS